MLDFRHTQMGFGIVSYRNMIASTIEQFLFAKDLVSKEISVQLPAILGDSYSQRDASKHVNRFLKKKSIFWL